MRRLALTLATSLLLAALPSFAQAPADHDHAMPAGMAMTPRDPKLPADENNAKDALEHSPRHGEYASIALADGAPVRTWVVYPERKDRAPVVILIHEVFGLSDWIRGVADQFAKEGFIAVVPDLLSGLGPGGGGTEAFASRDDVVKGVFAISPELATSRLDAVRAWALALPAANGRCATTGFCWGGARSFAYAASQPALDAAVVYYGVSPDSASLARIHAPVLGLYGGDDARVVTTVAPAERVMKDLHQPYETHVFAGAGHGFLRQQAERDGANRKAAAQAWSRTLAFLRKQLEGRKGR